MKAGETFLAFGMRISQVSAMDSTFTARKESFVYFVMIKMVI